MEHANITGAIKTVTGYAPTKKASITAIGRNGLIAASAVRQGMIKIIRAEHGKGRYDRIREES